MEEDTSQARDGTRLYTIGVERMIEDDPVDQLDKPYEKDETTQDDGLVSYSSCKVGERSSSGSVVYFNTTVVHRIIITWLVRCIHLLILHYSDLRNNVPFSYKIEDRKTAENTQPGMLVQPWSRWLGGRPGRPAMGRSTR